VRRSCFVVPRSMPMMRSGRGCPKSISMGVMTTLLDLIHQIPIYFLRFKMSRFYSHGWSFTFVIRGD